MAKETFQTEKQEKMEKKRKKQLLYSYSIAYA